MVCQNRKPTTIAAAKRKNATAAALSPNAVVDAAFATRSSGAVTDRVSCAPNGMQKRLVEILVDLRPETRDVDVDDVRLWVEVIVPDVLEQHRARHDLSGVLHQVLEKAIFARLQQDVVSGPRHAMRQPIENEIADRVACLLLLRNRPAAERFDASQQFGIGVGLRQIIVAACPQALDAIVDLAQRREDQRRRAIALGPERL